MGSRVLGLGFRVWDSGYWIKSWLPVVSMSNARMQPPNGDVDCGSHPTYQKDSEHSPPTSGRLHAPHSSATSVCAASKALQVLKPLSPPEIHSKYVFLDPRSAISTAISDQNIIFLTNENCYTDASLLK